MRLLLLLSCATVEPADGPAECGVDLPCPEDCDDGMDNDLDGLLDCLDSDCVEDRGCWEVCKDGEDNDMDGLVDCFDADCVGLWDCRELCNDGQDNDKDGLSDCEDADCSEDLACPEECTDGVDNDADASVDCADPECVRHEACIEDCGDGLDNDVDGLVDCEDADCSDVCTEDCTDGIDNDADAYTDCSDDECWGVGDCMSEITVVFKGGGGSLASEFSTPHFSGSPFREFVLELSSVSGSAHFSRNQQEYGCSWAAEGMRLRDHSSRSGGVAYVRARAVNSSGGCLGYINTATFSFGGRSTYSSSSPKSWRPEAFTVPLRIEGTSVIRAYILSSSQSYTNGSSWAYGSWHAELELVEGGPWIIGRPH